MKSLLKKKRVEKRSNESQAVWRKKRPTVLGRGPGSEMPAALVGKEDDPKGNREETTRRHTASVPQTRLFGYPKDNVLAKKIEDWIPLACTPRIAISAPLTGPWPPLTPPT
jgi:hypothetical protein